MQRIGYVSATDELGGADASLYELIVALDRERFEPHVVVPHEGPFAARYRALGVAVHVLPLQKLKRTLDPRWHLSWLLRAPLRVLRLGRLFRQLRPNVVHVNTSVEVLAGFAAWRHCRRSGARLVWHVRELELRPRWVERLVFGTVRRLAHTVIAISTPVATRIGDERVRVIPNGIDIARFRATAAATTQRPPTIGWVGRLAPGKGLDRVFDLFAAVRAHLPEARLVVMAAPVDGHAAHADGLRRRGAAFGDALQWLAPGPATECAYAAMDVLVHLPDLAEGLGRTVLEAQAAGVPAVTWRRGGLVDTLRDGVTGRFAPPGDLAAASRLALGLLTDPPRRAAMARAAREFAAECFSRERCARAVEGTYLAEEP